MAIHTYTKKDLDKKVGKNFTVGDLWLNPKITDAIKIDDALLDALDKFAEHFGALPELRSPNALYRTAATNAACGGAKGSLHVKGQAADFSISGVDPLELARYAEVLKLGGIGMYSNVKYIHIDTRAGQARWWLITSNSKTPGFGGVPVSFKQGHRSPAVKDIQNALKVKGFDAGPSDGIYGVRTATALIAYQRAYSLTPDGVFGRKTNQSMGLFDW